MEAKKCDRCGAFFERNEYRSNFRLYVRGGLYTDYPRDLCDDCAKELDKFMGEEIVEVKKKKKK